MLTEIKSKVVNNIRYSITHWPEINIFQIHARNLNLDGDGEVHAEKEIGTFNSKEKAEEHFDNIK